MTDEKTPTEEFRDNVEKTCRTVSKWLFALKGGLNGEIRRCRNDGETVELARAYETFRREWEGTKAAIKEVDAAFRVLKERDFPEALEESGLANVPLADMGQRVGVSVRTKASIASGKKEQAFEFFRADVKALEALEHGQWEDAVAAMEIGGRADLASTLRDAENPHIVVDSIRDAIITTTENLESLVVDHVNPQTLSSLAKNWAEEGKQLPEDLFTTYLQPSTTSTKITPK